jgi:hypothetical protein
MLQFRCRQDIYEYALNIAQQSSAWLDAIQAIQAIQRSVRSQCAILLPAQ